MTLCPSSVFWRIYNIVIRCTEISDTHAGFACHKNKYFTYYCFTSLIFIVLHAWLSILIWLSGDVEVNPGPDSVESSTDSSDNLNSASFNSLSNHFSILYLNIQSLLPKIDLIWGKAIAHDILIFTESLLKPTINDDSIYIENFLPPFRTDRRERLTGGVIAYIRDTLSCKWRTDLEIRGVEGLWLEINIKTKKILVRGFYRPPNSNTAYFNLIKENKDRASNTNTIDIIITGDFNFDISKPQNKISELTYSVDNGVYTLHRYIIINNWYNPPLQQYKCFVQWGCWFLHSWIGPISLSNYSHTQILESIHTYV